MKPLFSKMFIKRTSILRIFIAVCLLCGYGTHAVAPVFDDNLPERNAGELEDSARLLYSFTVSDTTNDFTCNVILNPIYGPFDVVQNSVSNARFAVYDVKTIIGGSGTPEYNETLYDVNLDCTNDASELSQGTLTINVIATDRGMAMTTIEGVETRNAATTTEVGTTIRDVGTVDYRDLVGDVIEHTMTCDNCNEFFTIHTGTGVVTTTQALERCHSSSINCAVTVTDGTFIVTGTLVIALTNLNTIPISLTMPTTKTVLETLASGSIIQLASVYDPDTGASGNRICELIVDPPAAGNVFDLDTSCNILLKSGESLNFEEWTFINITLCIDDSYINNCDQYLELTIADDNEVCTFDKSMYYGTASEGVAGSASIDALLTVTDPDVADVGRITYSLFNANDSDRLTIADTTGILGFATEYDVDTPNSYPTSFIVTVLCVDSGGPSGIVKTGSAQITLTINDINDNAPAFASAYSYTHNQLLSPGSTIGSFVPTDADSGTNADVSCSGSSTDTYASYYSIKPDCSVQLSRTPSPDIPYGTLTTFTVLGTDGGTPTRTGTTTVGVTFIETTTTTVSTTTTTSKDGFFDNPASIALLVLALLAGLALLGLLTWLCLRCCGVCGGSGGGLCDCRNMCRCKDRYRREVTPEEPVRKKRPPPREQVVVEEPQRTMVRRAVPHTRVIKAVPTWTTGPGPGMYGPPSVGPPMGGPPMGGPHMGGPLLGGPPMSGPMGMGPARISSGPPPYAR